VIAMTEVIFNDKNNMPGDEILSEKIGDSFQYWSKIKKIVEEEYESIREEWKFYGKNYGWQLKTLLKKRNLFFLIPYESFFKIVFIFGDKAVQEIENSNISDDIKNEIINAKKYMEGRGIAIEVKDGKHLTDIKTLIDIKIKN
jgi:hypothetical protein